MYEKIVAAWTDEIEKEELQDLEDLQLTKMTQYLSKVRMLLTETKADNEVQADLYTQEILNSEFMLKDLLMVRRKKIWSAVKSQRRPLGSMVLAEEELYNRLSRGYEKHSEFINESLSGALRATLRKGKDDQQIEEVEETDYILVKFQRAIGEAFLGIDEMTYGPFKKEDIATIPAENAKSWLQDGTVTRLSTEEGGS
jgi:DNA replication initiation complex subunit (GINS family)